MYYELVITLWKAIDNDVVVIGFLKVCSHWLLLIPVFSCHGDGLVKGCSGSCDHILPISELLSHLLSSMSADIISKVCLFVCLSVLVYQFGCG